MTPINELIEEFLAEGLIGSGVSSEKPDAANAIYKKLRDAGYTVWHATNPKTDTVEGDPCYPNLAAIQVCYRRCRHFHATQCDRRDRP